MLDGAKQDYKCVKAKPVVRRGRKVTGLDRKYSRWLGHQLM